MPVRLRVLLSVFLVTGIVVVSSVIITFWFGNRVFITHAREQARREAINRLDELESVLKDAETGQRGFIITGDEAYLQPFDQAAADWQTAVDRLRSFHWVDVQSDEIEGIVRLGKQKMEELHSTIDLRRGGGMAAVLPVVREGVGKHYMDRLRAQVRQLKLRETKGLETDAALSDRATRLRTAVFLLCGAINLIVLYWGYRRTAETLKERDLALDDVRRRRLELQRQKDLLAVTLASIGDCVIVTNDKGNITFMNRVAEQVTGWNAADAVSRPTTEIFRILNEHTRLPVEDPVAKVIRQGTIVGLANHTLLIRKDDSEIPIDDSGAPIRDEKGNIQGVVLVFRDFSEHKRAEHELRVAKEEAETANKAKDQFLAMLSHELRTPLTPVLATLNLWEASEEIPTAMQPDLRMLRHSVELEARIIDDLLDLTRIARGLLTFSPETTDVHSLIEFLAGLSQSELQLKEIVTTLELNAQRHHVYTDASRLQQVLWNILRNAIKFTPPGGGIVVITSNNADGNLEIVVTDTGIGMTPEVMSRIFLPFEQADPSRSHRYGGLGLGLTISKALVDLLEGDLTAESPGPGKGSTFRITFPTADPDTAEAQTAASPSRHLEKVRLLLIEDHGDTARALSRLLENRGFGVLAASSIASALQAVEHEEFDLILCDLGLPDGSGIDFIKKVRSHLRTPAIALTGFGMQEDVERANSAGFDAHLTKPVNLPKLEATIWRLLNGGRDE